MFWEHLLKSIYAIVTTFGLIFCLIFFIGYRRGGGQPNPKLMEIKTQLFDYFFVEHVEMNVLLCLMVAGIRNYFTYVKNKQHKFIVQILFIPDDKEFTFKMINCYSNSKSVIHVKAEALEFKTKSENLYVFGKNKFLEFKDKKTNISIGRIDSDHEIHCNFRKEIQNALKRIEAII